MSRAPAAPHLRRGDVVVAAPGRLAIALTHPEGMLVVERQGRQRV